MKCAVYARVSKGFDSEKTSISTQIKLFDNFIKEKGWELYKVYTDIKSGSKSNRNGIQELIQVAKDKKFDIVLAKELSRISRNGGFSYEFKNVLIINRIHFITLDCAINTLDTISPITNKRMINKEKDWIVNRIILLPSKQSIIKMFLILLISKTSKINCYHSAQKSKKL